MKVIIASLIVIFSLSSFAKKVDASKSSAKANRRESFLLSFENFKKLPYEKKIVYVNFLSQVSAILEKRNNDAKEVLPKDLESAFWQRSPSLWERLMQIAIPEADAEDSISPTEASGPPQPEASTPAMQPESPKTNAKEAAQTSEEDEEKAETQSIIEKNAKDSMSKDSQRKLYLDRANADAKKADANAKKADANAKKADANAKKADANAKKAVYTRRKGAVCLFGNRGSRYAENPNPNGKNPYCPPPRGTVNTKICKGTPKPNYLCPSFGLTLAASDKQENNNFCVTLYSDKGLDDLSKRCSQQLRDVRGRLQANKPLYEQQTAELQKHVDEFKRFGDNENDKYSIEAYCAENNAANEGRQSQECSQILAAIDNLRNNGIAVDTPAPAPADAKPSTGTLPEANAPANTPPAPNPPEGNPIEQQVTPEETGWQGI